MAERKGQLYQSGTLVNRTAPVCIDGSRVGLILTNPEGAEFTYAIRFRFEATNNESEYEALIAGLRISEQHGCKEFAESHYVDQDLWPIKLTDLNVAKRVRHGSVLKQDALSKIASTRFAHLSKQVLVEELKEKYINEKEILRRSSKKRATQWMTPHMRVPANEIIRRIKRRPIGVRYRVPPMLRSREAPPWECLVERANRSLGEGIKARLDERSKD
ncbi:reverse transcriptase domain-containing protein [Tanacetum coccineum]